MERLRRDRFWTRGDRGGSAHLDQRPVGSDDLDDDHHGDADHGGQGQSPAERDGPVGILVDLVVRQRLVFDQREDEAALNGGTASDSTQEPTGAFSSKFALSHATVCIPERQRGTTGAS